MGNVKVYIFTTNKCNIETIMAQEQTMFKTYFILAYLLNTYLSELSILLDLQIYITKL